MKTIKIASFLFILALVFSFTAQNAQAADFRIAGKDNGNVNVEKSETIKNLYAAGNLVSIDAYVQKGLHAAGNVVTINGDVGGTVYSGAGTLMINGNVGGSVHGGGGSVVINSRITDDLFIGGGNIVVSKSASVGGDLFIGGGNVDIEGLVMGDAYMGGGTITINSEIRGDVKISSADKIKIGKDAKISGNLKYYSKNKIEIEEGAIISGETTIIAKEGAKGGNSAKPDKGTVFAIIFGIISLAILVKMGGLIAVGLVLVYMFKNVTERVVRESLTSFWKSLGVGLLSLIVIPIATIILLITLVGIWLGIIVGIMYALSILLAVSFASITFGSWALGVIRKNKDYVVNWKVVVGGVIVMGIVGLIPVIGRLFFFIFMLISFGSIYRLAYISRKS